jgi:hypothetical protein
MDGAIALALASGGSEYGHAPDSLLKVPNTMFGYFDVETLAPAPPHQRTLAKQRFN